MKLRRPMLLLVAITFCLAPLVAMGQPSQGDRTLSLGFNQLSYEKSTRQICDSDGNNGEDETKNTYLRMGLGLGGGYLMSDRFEAGFSIGAATAHYETEYMDDGDIFEIRDHSINTNIYGKLHFISSTSKLVPFLSAGVGLSYSRSKFENNLDAVDEPRYDRFGMNLFGSAGIDYYIAEHYAITALASLYWNVASQDQDTDDDDSPLYKYNSTSLRLGLGITTYF